MCFAYMLNTTLPATTVTSTMLAVPMPSSTSMPLTFSLPSATRPSAGVPSSTAWQSATLKPTQPALSSMSSRSTSVSKSMSWMLALMCIAFFQMSIAEATGAAEWQASADCEHEGPPALTLPSPFVTETHLTDAQTQPVTSFHWVNPDASSYSTSAPLSPSVGCEDNQRPSTTVLQAQQTSPHVMSATTDAVSPLPDTPTMFIRPSDASQLDSLSTYSSSWQQAYATDHPCKRERIC